MTDAELTDLRCRVAAARVQWDAATAAAEAAIQARIAAYVAFDKLNSVLTHEEQHRAWLKEYEAGLRGEPAPAAPKEEAS